MPLVIIDSLFAQIEFSLKNNNYQTSIWTPKNKKTVKREAKGD